MLRWQSPNMETLDLPTQCGNNGAGSLDHTMAGHAAWTQELTVVAQACTSWCFFSLQSLVLGSYSFESLLLGLSDLYAGIRDLEAAASETHEDAWSPPDAFKR